MATENKHTNTYRRIVSSTAVFGGAQVFNLLAGIVRGKLVAIILRSAGMGMSSVIGNAAGSLQQLALMGLNVSAVPDVSKAADSDNATDGRLAVTVSVVRHLVLVAATVGLVLTLVTAPLLSKLSFGSGTHTNYFLLLSVAVFFNVLAMGEQAILQGMRKYKRLAFASTVPPLCGLLLSIPIYYIWGLDGIVPSMIVIATVYFLAMRLLSFRGSPARVGWREALQRGRGMLRLGAVMTVGMLIGTLTNYLLVAFIARQGSLSDVGFYQAATTITTQTVSLVFTAMAADYFPHLAQLLEEGLEHAFRFVCQQMEIIVLIVTPLIMLLITLTPVAIRLMLTSEFLVIGQVVRLMAMACVFKALCFPMDYIAYAKQDAKYIFWIETMWGGLKTFAFLAGGYYIGGFVGLGYGALLNGAVELLSSLFFIRWRYGFVPTADVVRLMTLMIALAAACLAASMAVGDSLTSNALMGMLTVGAFIVCSWQLDKRMKLREYMLRLRTKMERSDDK